MAQNVAPINNIPLLNPIERQSSVWLKVNAYLEQRLMTLRERNDKHSDESKTANTRGRIAELKNLLALGSASAPQQQADDS